jgi:hypothetical protein
MKHFYTILIAILFTSIGFGQTTIYTQDFETLDDGYTASATEGSGFTDVFNRTIANVGGNTTNVWAVEDTNVTPATITLDQIDVTGYSEFTFSIDMIAHHFNDWDDSDTFSVTYSLDGGASQNLLWVRNNGGTFNQLPSLDTNFDGVGDCGAGTLPALTTGTSGCSTSDDTFSTFSSDVISLSGNTTLDITLSFEGLTSGDEGIYLDNIVVEAESGGAPSPTVGFDSASSSENETNTTFTSSNIPISVTNYDGNQIDIDVNVTGGTAEPGDYTFTSPTALSFTSDGTQNITIDINDDADFDDETVELTITETSSVTGLVISQATHTVTILDDDTPPLPNIVINEILADPTGIDANGDGTVDSQDDEFVELVNNDNVSVDITGYTLSDGFSVRHTFGSVVIPAGGSVVVFGGGLPTGISGLSEVASSGALGLNNGGDTVTLEDGSSNIIAFYSYGSEGGDDQSIGRSEDLFGNFVQHTTIQTNPVAASPGLYNVSGLPFSTITWKGSIDTDWTNGSNWSGGNSPTVLDDILILNVANAPIIASAVSVNNATVNPGASLTISSAGSLNSSTLNLFSFSNSFSNLILDGTLTGTVTYNRYVNTNDAVNGNDLISAPLSGQAFDVFIGNNTNILTNSTGPEVLFGGFDNDNASAPYELWNDTDTTPLTAGVGYRTGIEVGAPTNLVSFEGTVNNGLVEVAINQGSASILNLVGNPFPSYLDAQAFLTQNAAVLDPSAVVIYGYNDSTDGTSADDYTIISAIENNTLNIAPGQGFFVASNVVGGNLQFTTSTPDMRIISTDDDFIAGRSAISNVNINLSSATDNFITKVYFTASSGLGLDPGYDASLLGGVAPAFSLFSHLVEENMDVPFATQAIGKTDYNDTTIALGVNANMGEQLTFSIAENTMPASIEVYLDDTLTSTSTLLNAADYVLTPSEDLNGTGRFYLRFSNSALSTTDAIFDGISIYGNQTNRTISIAGELTEGTIVNVYDIQGRLVTARPLVSDSTLQTIDASNLHTGVYIVKLVNGNAVKTQKIILK